MSHRISARELSEWAAFEKIYGPILIHERVDIAGALVAAILANINSKRKYEISDFLPKWTGATRKAQTADEVMALLMGLVERPQPSPE